MTPLVEDGARKALLLEFQGRLKLLADRRVFWKFGNDGQGLCRIYFLRNGLPFKAKFWLSRFSTGKTWGASSN